VAITDFDYLATRNEIIQRAFRIVGALEPGQVLSADMFAQGVDALQQLVKSWSNNHLFLWSFDQSSFSTVSTQSLYTTTELTGDDDAIIGLDKAWVVDSNDDLPLEVISYSRYQDIHDKDSSGRPQVIAFKPTPSPSFYLWPVPDAIYTIKLLSIYPLKDFDDAAGSGDVPAKFQKALTYCLAEDLFDEYPGPMNERTFIAAKAAELFRKAKNADMPVETNDEVEGFYRGRR
jgi:hypothetical protein